MELFKHGIFLFVLLFSIAVVQGYYEEEFEESYDPRDYLPCGSYVHMEKDQKYYIHTETGGNNNQNEHGYHRYYRETTSNKEVTTFEDTAAMRMRRGGVNGYSNCQWTFESQGKCQLMVHFDHYYPGDRRCSNQYVFVSDDETEIQACSTRGLPRAYESATNKIKVKHYRKPYIYLTEFEAYVICHSPGTGYAVSDDYAAAYKSEDEVEQGPHASSSHPSSDTKHQMPSHGSQTHSPSGKNGYESHGEAEAYDHINSQGSSHSSNDAQAHGSSYNQGHGQQVPASGTNHPASSGYGQQKYGISQPHGQTHGAGREAHLGVAHQYNGGNYQSAYGHPVYHQYESHYPSQKHTQPYGESGSHMDQVHSPSGSGNQQHNPVESSDHSSVVQQSSRNSDEPKGEETVEENPEDAKYSTGGSDPQSPDTHYQQPIGHATGNSPANPGHSDVYHQEHENPTELGNGPVAHHPSENQEYTQLYSP